MGRDTLEEIIRFTLEETYDSWDGYYLSCTNPDWEENLIRQIADNFLAKIVLDK